MPIHTRRRLASLAAIAITVALIPVGSAATASSPPPTDPPVEALACPASLLIEPGFADLTGGVHDEAIACLTGWGLLEGREAERFDPTDTLDRGAAARLLHRVLALAEAGGETDPADRRASDTFPDLDDGDLGPIVQSLAALGVVTGFEDGTFRASLPVTRAQFASLAGRSLDPVLGIALPDVSGRFADVEGPPHARAIEGLAELGVLRGTTDGLFVPGAGLTREQAASVVVRVLGVLVTEGLITTPETPPSPEPPDPTVPDCDAPDAEVDACVRLNELQVLGTHNSYKLLPPSFVLGLISAVDPAQGEALAYEHRPIPEQLEQLGIRQLELDVFADPDGGRYARPLGGLLTLNVPEGGLPDLLDPGFKVLHVQDVDYETTCPTLVSCLEQVRDFSVTNPVHVPIAVLIETKTAPVPVDVDELPFQLLQDFTVPLPITTELLDELDAEIRSVFDDEHLIVPDDVRGTYDTLEQAVLDGGWPTLGEARGRVLFLLDQPSDAERYRQGRPNLEGRVMFTPSAPGQPDAAFVKVNEPIGNVEQIRALVEAGYVVRTRADVPTADARTNDTTRREAALSSGAQWVSTDYPEPSTVFDSVYRVELPGGGPARCNPVNAPPACRDAALE